jgi:hypothetical protein
MNKKKGKNDQKKTKLNKIDERRISNFGGQKNELTEIKKLQLIENYQQSYSRQRTPDDSMMIVQSKIFN